MQGYLLQQTLSIDVLEKLFKKSCNDKIKNQIEQQIQTLKVSAEKPDKIKKGVQLVLAKLLALKDINDYVQIKEKKTSLEEQWNSYHQEFTCLTSIECESFNGKYQDIKTQLSRHFAPLHEAFEQQLIADKLVQDKKAATENFTTKLNEINKQLTTTIFESGELDEEKYKVHLETLITEIKSSTLNNQEQDHFITLVNVQNKKLVQLPEIAKSVTDATHLISKISQVAIPKTIDELNLRKPLFDDWLQEWKTVEKKASGILPESIVDAFQEIKKQWQQGLKPLIKEQDSLLSQCHKKISDVKRLITSGKYNAAFGVFKKAKKNFDLLSGVHCNSVVN